MFRHVQVIIRLSFEQCLSCTINSAQFGIPEVYTVLDYCYFYMGVFWDHLFKTLFIKILCWVNILLFLFLDSCID